MPPTIRTKVGILADLPAAVVVIPSIVNGQNRYTASLDSDVLVLNGAGQLVPSVSTSITGTDETAVLSDLLDSAKSNGYSPVNKKFPKK